MRMVHGDRQRNKSSIINRNQYATIQPHSRSVIEEHSPITRVKEDAKTVIN